MNAFLTTVRNIAVLSLATIVIMYGVVLLEIGGVLPHSELSNNVMNEVVSKLGE